MDIKEIIKFIVGSNEYKDKGLDGINQLNRSLIMAAKCRFLASSRLKHIGLVTSLITIFLSLCLIFIPLMQIASLNLSLPNDLLNIIQIFLAVSILVYSVINTQARYTIRSEKLNQCGDKIKELQRQLNYEIKNDEDPSYKAFLDRYHAIEVDAENHARVDYHLARLDLTSIYTLSGLWRVGVIVKAYCRKIMPYFVTTVLVLVVMITISDLFRLYTPISDTLVPLLPKRQYCEQIELRDGEPIEKEIHNLNSEYVAFKKPALEGAINNHEMILGIQRHLNIKGYNSGDEDGFMGPVTRKAIKKFQKENSLPVDGKASHSLLSILSADIHG